MIRNNLLRIITVAFCGIPLIFILFSMGMYDLYEQGVKIKAAQPLFDAVVTKKIKVGDNINDVKRILTYAELSFSEHQQKLHSIYRAGWRCGILLEVTFDDSERVVKIKVQPGMTGL